MPFQSEAQRGYMFVHHPEIAKRWAAETPKDAKLPEHVQRPAPDRERERATRAAIVERLGR